MLHKRYSGIVTTLLLLAAQARAEPSEDWPQFRGPQGNGEARVIGTPIKWGGLLRPPAWQTDIPGRGWSSPIVVGERVWLTSAEQTALDEQSAAQRLAKHPHGDREFQAHASVQLLAIELEAQSGNILRRIDLGTVENPPLIHFTNSYASPTPLSDGVRLFCHFGSLGTIGLSIETGEILWRRRFQFDDITGPAASPVLDDDRLILACDAVDDQFVVALDAATGEERWRVQRPPIDAADGKHHRSFSTPLVIQEGTRKQVVAPAAQWIVAYDPESGRELWRVDGGKGMHAAVPRPVYRSGVVYVCTGYPKPELWAIRTDGRGDVTASHVLWKCSRQVPEISSPILTEEHVYFVSTGGVLSCLERDKGTLVWQERLAGTFAASPLLADGKLYLTNTDGMTWVIQPGTSYRELAVNSLRVQSLASLALHRSNLLLRSHPTLFCIRGEQGSDRERSGNRVDAE